MNSVVIPSEQDFYGGNGHHLQYDKGITSSGFVPRNLPLSAAGFTSSSSTLYSKSVISCAPTFMRSQASHSSTPQTPNSIPNIEITGMLFPFFFPFQ